MKHDFLYLIWKDPRFRRNYIVGKLSRSEKFFFEYCGEYIEAKEAGWEYLQAFPEEKQYESEVLFAAFASRLPDPKRRGIEDILRKYNLPKYDGFELLRKSTGRLPIDTYEFIDPIFPEEETVRRDFYIVGIRHVADCIGKDCNKLPGINVGNELVLKREPENEYDKYAVQVSTQEGILLGYIPRYYSESVSMRIEKGITYSCNVLEIHTEKNCDNCIKIRLEIPRRDNNIH